MTVDQAMDRLREMTATLERLADQTDDPDLGESLSCQAVALGDAARAIEAEISSSAVLLPIRPDRHCHARAPDPSGPTAA